MKCQRETDGRKLSSQEKESLRLRVVRRIEAGIHPEDLARDLDINRRTVYRWLEKYHYGGEEALKTELRPGREPKLNALQMSQLARMIRDRNPLQLHFTFALWNRAMVRELIRREFGVRLSETSVGRLLRRLGFSPQRPLRRAYEQDRTRVEQWRREEFPAIQRQAKAVNAIIFFADEAGVRSDYHTGHTWAPVGQTPVVPRTGARFSLQMLSAISAQGEMRFMVHEGSVTADTFCEFLTRLAAGMERKIYLVVDGHSIHKAAKVQKHLAALGGQITLFFLPPYSPDLNADEWVWKQVKQRIARQSVRTRDDLKRVALSALRSLQQMPEKIRGFFRDPACCYAAAQV
jgi:transposase